jgi:DMSO/TMAO reductase YedYZ molybdopterin-dependent catalytic subunit
MSERRMGRATFLSVIGLGGLGLLAGGRISSALSGPLGAAGSVLPQGVKDLLPVGGWRIYAINPPWPTFDQRRYRLEVTGHVQKPVSLTWDEVAALPSEQQTTDFHCVTGWSVGGVHWQGIRLQTLWDMVQPLPEVRYVNFVSLERPYIDTLSLDQTTLSQVMLAHHMDGAPLSRAHGAPLRLVIPEMYGYKNVKWLTRVELVPKLVPGYWEQNGYDVDAWVGRSNGYGI